MHALAERNSQHLEAEEDCDECAGMQSEIILFSLQI
jgi:hypothetical protein